MADRAGVHPLRSELRPRPATAWLRPSGARAVAEAKAEAKASYGLAAPPWNAGALAGSARLFSSLFSPPARVGVPPDFSHPNRYVLYDRDCKPYWGHMKFTFDISQY